MIQNLKIDIIYYDTPSDFEFEFNLGGCCYSRILNNKTSSPKEMVGCLSKAVSRSRVILIIGKLDGSDGLINLISKAISVPLSEVNAEEYGIVPGTDTTVIANSLPLISTDGLLSGCIIESGPQSIILLPEAKSLRKDIAENLVFQYITAVSRTPDTESVVTPDSTQEVTPDNEDDGAVSMVEEEQPECIAEDSEEQDQTTGEEENETQENILVQESMTLEEKIGEEVAHIEAEIQVPEKETEEQNEEEKFIDIYAESATEDESANIDDNYVYNAYSESDKEEYEEYEDDDREDEIKPRSGINTFIWVIVGLMLIIVAILAYILVYTPISEGVNVVEYINQVLNI